MQPADSWECVLRPIVKALMCGRWPAALGRAQYLANERQPQAYTSKFDSRCSTPMD